MAFLVRHMTHKATTTRTSETTVSVSVEGFKQPITFENIQNIKSPYTPENIAEITYEILMGYPDISKRMLNQFTIHVNCWSEKKGDNNAEVRPIGYSNWDKGFVDAVELGVPFDGTMKSIVYFAHELVHVAQFASRRLRMMPRLHSSGDYVVFNTAFSVAGKVIQKGKDIPYLEQVCEWEAFGMQGTLANAIMGMLGGDVMQMIRFTSKSDGWETFCEKIRNNLMTLEHYGWEYFDYEIQSAYGEAKQTKGRTKVSACFRL